MGSVASRSLIATDLTGDRRGHGDGVSAWKTGCAMRCDRSYPHLHHHPLRSCRVFVCLAREVVVFVV